MEDAIDLRIVKIRKITCTAHTGEPEKQHTTSPHLRCKVNFLSDVRCSIRNCGLDRISRSDPIENFRSMVESSKLTRCG